MNILRARVAFRERTVLDVLDLSVRFMVAHWRAYLTLALFVTVPSIAGSFAVASGTSVGWAWTITLLAGLVLQGPFTVLASQLVFADVVATRRVLLDSLRALPRLFFARFVQVMGLFTTVWFFVIPALWLAARWLFVPEVSILERSGISQTINRAGRLVDNRFGEAAMALLLVTLLHLGLTLGGEVAGRMVLEDLLQIHAPPSLWTRHALGAVALVAYWGAIPFIATARFFVYLDLRARAEGWDIQTRFATIAARCAEDEARLAARGIAR